MTMRAYTVRFGPVDVHAVSEQDALSIAATLIRTNPDFYKEQVLLWEGDENGKVADTPPDQRTATP